MRWLIILLILSLIGNAVGLFIAYKFYRADKALKVNQNMLEALNEHLTKKLIFLHHSVGQIWLTEGNLKAALMANGFSVHDATYGDEIGQETDVCHWLPKFRNDMDKIFKFDKHPNIYYSDGAENDIIVFKSCYPNSNIVDEGEMPGDPLDKKRTVANYRAVFENLKETFENYPDKKFIYVTAPPLVPAETTPDKTVRARKFNEWLKLEFVPQYREETGLNNFYVFDFFNVLADEQNYLKKEFRRVETDSHPNAAAGKAATAAFIEFLKDNNI
ncbi:MAG: hypothetical protein JXA92_07565 [candidate division Zixibacteria bacterium]|nr:hypothetical protein [candidate division Zixibacteria bacterium]